MATEVRFQGWQRPAAGRLVSGPADQGRAPAQVTLRLSGLDRAGAPATEERSLAFLLAGPGDVVSLQPGAVARRYPAPGTLDVETTKCPYAEFADSGLPWRYLAEANPPATNRALRPWIVLVVGTAEEIQVGAERATLSTAVLGAHPLADSHRWAHIQEADGHAAARVLSPRPLTPGTDYVAALVGSLAVAASGSVGPAWGAAGPVTVPVYDHWRFRTADAGGDFRSLATALKPGSAAASTGRAPLVYPRLPDAAPLGVRGALAPPGSTDAALPAAVAADLARLAGPRRDASGRPVVGLPVYGDAWHADPPTTQWGRALNGDPRHRVVAGLGVELAVALQDELVGEATRQAGARDIADQRIRELTAGLAAASSLWRRRLPSDPARRLWLFGPGLPRLMTEAGPVAALATAEDRPLPAELFSSAARRVLRRGPARAHGAGATDPAELLAAANRCPPPSPFAEVGIGPLSDLGAGDFDLRRLEVGSRGPDVEALLDVLGNLDPSRFPDLSAGVSAVVQRVRQAVHEGRRLPWTKLALLLAALGSGISPPDPDVVYPLRAELDQSFESMADDDAALGELTGQLVEAEGKAPPCRPVDIEALERGVSAALDPSAEDSAARRRVLAGISGLDGSQPLAPPEICPGIALPAWRSLERLAPDWLLPGVGQQAPDTVIAVETNPTFVDAFLVGLNTQLLGELRWRNLRVATGCTPMRVFWERADAAGSGARVDDIVGVRGWHDGSDLGAAQHRRAAVPGRDLVLLFKGHLFLRYPETLLYLTPARRRPSGGPDFGAAPDPASARSFPSFQGRIGKDVVYFGFHGVASSVTLDHWIVLEESPAGVRFRNDVPAMATATDGAHFADLTFANPVRVLIQGDRLVGTGAG